MKKIFQLVIKYNEIIEKKKKKRGKLLVFQTTESSMDIFLI